MYHYDGKSWEPVKLSYFEGGSISGPIDLTSIYGFGPANIFAVGEKIYVNENPPPKFLDSSLIIHYDGSRWSEIRVERTRGLLSVWGSSSSDVWIGGAYGSLYHYNGIAWDRIQFDSTMHIGYLFGLSSSNIYASAAQSIESVDKQSPLDSSKWALFHYNGSRWNLIDSVSSFPGSPFHTFGVNRVWGIDESNMYSIGRAVFRKYGSSWQMILNTDWPMTAMAGTSATNFFVAGPLRYFYHFDGSTWFPFQIAKIPDGYVDDIWCSDTEIFVLLDDGKKSYVLHGK